MTMHLAGYERGPRRKGGLASIREDIHVHAAASTVRAALADPSLYRPWLPDALREVRADSEGATYILSLPAREEALSLRREVTEDPREVVYRMDEGGAVDALRWALHPEGLNECHVTVELLYRPAGGLFGGAMETLMHRGQRTQVIRDLLWNLKRDMEAGRNSNGSAREAAG